MKSTRTPSSHRGHHMCCTPVALTAPQRAQVRTVEEASNCMALDGIMFEGVAVRIRRPNDYNPAAAARHGPAAPSPHLNLAAVNLQTGGVDSEDRVRKLGWFAPLERRVLEGLRVHACALAHQCCIQRRSHVCD
jgi:hypothetical protein